MHMEDNVSGASRAGSSWWVYMVACADGTLYTGVTTNVPRRVEEHNGAKAAKYTRSRQPVRLVYEEEVLNRRAATRREAEIKQLTREQKKQLCQNFNLT